MFAEIWANRVPDVTGFLMSQGHVTRFLMDTVSGEHGS